MESKMEIGKPVQIVRASAQSTLLSSLDGKLGTILGIEPPINQDVKSGPRYKILFERPVVHRDFYYPRITQTILSVFPVYADELRMLA
jgi:hypothetical protein